MKNISILGATGSVGTQTLQVIRNQKERFKLVAFSANKNYEGTISIIKEFKPKCVAVVDKYVCEKVRDYCKSENINIEIFEGVKGLTSISILSEVDIVVTSIVGMIGLVPTLNAIRAGKDIALANKETLVTGGEIVMKEAEKYNVRILPVDSEHSAIFQSLQGNNINSIDKIILTASGGPFRGKTTEELVNISPEEAIKHPNWNMGKKISIDSSTLVNKGLEVIEARWLFGVDYNNIEVVVHPESVIHSMVEYKDGSIIAQISSADMVLPIQYALNYPNRENSLISKLNFYEIGKLTFHKPDINNFRGLKLAYDAGIEGGIMPTIFNAANEEAVQLFLQKKIKYLDIIKIIEDSMNNFENKGNIDLEMILNYEKMVRRFIQDKYNF
ncbi:1-deoxy-D-xylulose-5-phosphate reductoisomerase [Clostridium sp. MB40-C1]|uniref:1-deoxy-D-xylulose-5-phosphate reductoisomerase n=1 Tax=Clostridium sp. MB40-C1 TaxID=3070996 RepID=UPI0027DF8E98|nr:1-deoxy-D-xylulose-5-phosphate reductoisomerase [Clostridium sp. MB40-C1]WMJ82030.1 1-deoxy-D-xylulose-5-phosphate reductoisomerase [Clostridium sp. MB40-C1]